MSWQPVSVAPTSLQRVSPLAHIVCDPLKELIWSGSSDGVVTCLYAPQLEVRMRVQAQPRNAHLLQLSVTQNGFLSTSSGGVRFHNRGGILKNEFDSVRSSFHSLTAAAAMEYSNEIMIAGIQFSTNEADEDAMPEVTHGLSLLDIASNQIVMQSATDFDTVTLATGRMLVCGTSGNSLSLHDPRSFQQLRTLPGHAGGSRKVIVKGDRLLSLGYSVAPSETNMYGRVDNMVKVYDLRTNRPLPPLLFTLGGGPADACFLPNYSSTVLVCGLTGFWQKMDCETGLPDAEAFQVEVGAHASVTSCAISSTADLAFFGDSLGSIHAWTDKTDELLSEEPEKLMRMNLYSAPTEYVHASLEPNPVKMDEQSELTALPLPAEAEHDKAHLLSTLSSHLHTNYIPPPMPPVDDKLLHMNYHIKFNDDVGYINFNSHHKSSAGRSSLISINESKAGDYDFSHSNSSSSTSKTAVGGAFIPNHLPTLMKFCGKGRSIDKLRKKKSLPRSHHSMSGQAGAMDSYGFIGREHLLISKEYARVTIKIPRFGLYAFDFSSYNKTQYTGLDNLLPNSYCNPIIQLLYFIPTIRQSMLTHLCERENCLTCELGFLFHMLDHGKGNMVEPRNFLRALRQLPEAGGLGLLDVHENNATIQSPTHASGQAGSSQGGGGGLRNKTGTIGDEDELFLASKIQDFWRFLLEQLHKEERESAAFQQVLVEKQNQHQQLQYVYSMNQQRRHRNLNMTQNQLQQSFAQLQQTVGAQGNGEAAASLRNQLSHFLNQNSLLYEECEQLESDLFALQYATSERELYTNNQTHIERVFGVGIDQRVRCQGGHAPPTRPHESTVEKTALHFTLNAYPSHETDLTFDQLVTNSIRESGAGSQRLFCNTCSAFTIQSSSKSIRCSQHYMHAAPHSHFPRALNLMANVNTDLQWEWWKRRDERFGRSQAAASRAAAAKRKAAKPSNLFDRFNAAASGSSNPNTPTAAQSAPAPEYELKAGVVNAPSSKPATTPSSSSSSSSNAVAVPDEAIDSLDVHFLPHFLLMFISHELPPPHAQGQHNDSDNKTTRTFRVQYSAAKRIQAALDNLKQVQKNHYSSVTLLTQTLLATQLNASNLQQQLLVLTQQSFLVQTKLNLCLQQQQQLLGSVHHLSQQAQQAQAQGMQVPQQLSRQLQGMQGSLQQVQAQAAQLNGQKLALAQKLSAIQSATAAATATSSSQGSSNQAMAALQAKVGMLQAQLKALQQSFAERMEEGESQLRAMISAHLSEASYGISSAFDPAVLATASVDDIALYELAAVVAHVSDPPEKDSPLHSINGEHLVAHIKVERDVYDRIGGEEASTRLVKQITPTPSPFADRYSSTSPTGLTSPHSPTTSSLAVKAEQHDGVWSIFNDFVIRPSNGFEATRFSYLWKQPCAVVYKLMNQSVPEPSTTNSNFPARATSPSLPSPSNALVPSGSNAREPTSSTAVNPFMHESMIYSYSPSLSLRYHEAVRSFQPLVSHGPHMETMDSNTLVAIDCEFVSVQHELTEVDQISKEPVVVRPARLTLARVSVVRGSGPMTGVPFIDDYIATSEPVVDYLTKYSGIVPGDLDRSVSTHHLTTLKHAYVRLRALVERGVKFIGHGLKKDLQMINIFIPSHQVFDTVELFSLPNQRKLGLRFLALHLLNLNIQQDTHDSIEDARTALHLYHKYLELKQKGQLQQCIQQLYEEGHRRGFKV